MLSGVAACQPPFYCDYGLNLEFGERIFVNQNCSFYDLGGITIGDRTIVGPGVTLSTAGHPVEPNERFDGLTTAPIVIESKDVPPNCIVSSSGYVKRRDLNQGGYPSAIAGSKFAV